MRTAQGTLVMAALAVSLLGACARGDKVPNLMNIRSDSGGPDEFNIVPPKALEMPESLADLPDPTPGGANRTDQNPLGDAVAALGGRSNTSGQIAAGDGALYNYATRAGVTPGIRQTLAAEDLDFRKRHKGKLLERALNLNVYFKAYRAQSLDQYAELQRWRKAGARTPSAPPK